jgi:AraC family transcriptional regulator of adaptative response / DNA-3-methyladenine glycosylase II
MNLDADAAYLALKARDARFDGRLFVGVTSTRIYCRPICRVRTPKKENCRFFATAAQAEARSFRPCLKCRPEIAPGPGFAWSVMDASRTLALQAADWLDSRTAHGEATGLAVLAARLGVSDRHLRRIFSAEHGVTPLQYLQTRRLLTAKHLLTDTRMPVAQVALASGFASLRRFNAAFADNYRMTPSRLRGDADDDGGRPASAEAVGVTLAFRAPYDVVRLTRFLDQRAIPRIEQVEGLRIRRTLRAGAIAGTAAGAGAAGWIEAEFVPAASRLRLRFSADWAAASANIVAAVRRWLDLDAAPETIGEALGGLPGDEGLRLPGSLDAFELAVRAVLGQQVTVAAARTLARRVVERFGEEIATPWDGIDRAFPQPACLAALPVERIAELGIIRTRANAIIAIARAWPALSPRLAPRQPPEPLIAALRELPGIGPWTAHYIAMRALSWPDAFPPHDVAVLKAMKRLFDTPSQREVDARATAWRPWRAYAVLRLWNSLETMP